MKSMWLVAVVTALKVTLSAAAPPCADPTAEAKAKQAEQAKTPEKRAELARQAIAACASHAGAHNALGTALEETGNFEGARAEYQKASELAPAWYLPALGLGDLAKRAGDAKAAEAQYRRARSLARSEEEREAADRALAEVGQPGGGYAFKTAEAIARGLKLSEAAPAGKTRSFGEAEPVGEDFYESAQGPAVNLSVIFRVNSAELTAEGTRQLDELGKALAGARRQIRFRIEGYSSSEGSKDVNLALSKARALGVRKYLGDRYGLPASRLEAVGLGTRSPVIENGQENRAKSRRVTLIRLYDDK